MMSSPNAIKPQAMNKKESQALRNCLGKFATGVTVVTCDGPGGPCGITVNSFTSVSLEPPLILWNVGKQSNALHAYFEAQHFAVNVLTAKQQAVAEHFAQSEMISFEGQDYRLNGCSVPLLADTLACIECRTDQVLEAGDHYIIIGAVDSFTSRDGEPLLFFASDYKTLG